MFEINRYYWFINHNKMQVCRDQIIGTGSTINFENLDKSKTFYNFLSCFYVPSQHIFHRKKEAEKALIQYVKNRENKKEFVEIYKNNIKSIGG